MKTRSVCLALAAILCLTAVAQAHFVWVAAVKDANGSPTAQVWFSELAEPDSADLLDKITSVQVVSRKAGEAPRPLTVTKQAVGSGGALIGSLPAGSRAISAHIKYGVLTRREQTFLLQYYAKYLDSSDTDLAKLARDERLALDVVPHPSDKGISLEVLYKGQPVAGSEVVILDPSANQIDAKTDDKGRVELTSLKPGLYSVRAKWVVAESGREEDKDYAQVNHYSTLALRVTK